MKKVIVTIYCLVLLIALTLCVAAHAEEGGSTDRTYTDEVITETI